MIFDTHVHSMVSPDSEMHPQEAIAILAEKGLGCTFTEHIDYNTQGVPFFCADLDAYPRDYIQYKSDTVRLGLEISLIPQCISQNTAHAAHQDIDYIIGSIHWIDGWDIYHAKDYFAQSGDKVYDRYLSYALEMVKLNDFFDVLGHIDYISRYSSLPEKNILYEKYADAYDALLKALIERDKLLELNTSRLGDENACKNLFAIYSRYRDLGGRYVTIGSDSHNTGKLGYKFDKALEMIDEIGLKPVHFKNRQMII
ncbi:MAG: histidinol-phosphatase HisJ family protein [Defluviitaleaceae bacterium]|nr:histidinol-phosphatase HisJ family protein [Defluviitaleaceae bacterium]